MRSSDTPHARVGETQERRQKPSQRVKDAAERRLLQAYITTTVALISYILVYGSSITSSLSNVAQHGATLPNTASVGDRLFNTALTVFVAIGAVAALRLHHRTWPSMGRWVWSRQRAPWATVLGALSVPMLALALGDALLFPLLHHAHLANHLGPAPRTDIWLRLSDAASAGIGEEILVLAVPVAVLRFYRVPTAAALTLLTAIRVAYHLYYGWGGVWWLVPWAIGSAAVYWRWPDVRLLALLITMHTVFDSREILLGTHYVAIWVAAAIAAVAIAVIAQRQWWNTPALTYPSVPLIRAITGYRTSTPAPAPEAITRPRTAPDTTMG